MSLVPGEDASSYALEWPYTLTFGHRLEVFAPKIGPNCTQSLHSLESETPRQILGSIFRQNELCFKAFGLFSLGYFISIVAQEAVFRYCLTLCSSLAAILPWRGHFHLFNEPVNLVFDPLHVIERVFYNSLSSMFNPVIWKSAKNSIRNATTLTGVDGCTSTQGLHSIHDQPFNHSKLSVRPLSVRGAKGNRAMNSRLWRLQDLQIACIGMS